ncbi:MAG: hypothetical protein NOF05_11595 [Candidatus Accumulibacter phosphatis]|uniref:Uncharacterized protein n=3 Tax=Candidatus Accumulibacter TaxID=327159 RepID=A0A080M734_9PROT|nr:MULTISPECIES: DUF6587 family protein [Candidatus Accumulibacter]KFB76796.1 MAG: hypothetical protein AW06_002113 [Candidatus Accumulibacter cognatus]MBO3712548.1 hypothetical protein [Accumulibacter sp.]MCC2868449.1 hypothetical protein [Candidatus Accumulibacter phosphatis]MCM8581163.1 hypothetical protein [Accumulibacter sp.]MCQ1549437.1 hypothetical protein [Candidatus Accumulibacter phosphatis]
MLEEWIVYGAVICATIYAARRLLPGVLRAALVECYVTLAQRFGLAPADAGSSGREASDKAGNACGGCTGCSGCGTKQEHRHVMIIKSPGK